MVFVDSPYDGAVHNELSVYHNLLDFIHHQRWAPISSQDPICEEKAECLEFIKKLMAFDPKNRITMDQIVEDAWIRDEWLEISSGMEAPLINVDGQWTATDTWEELL
ncbi:hypothetical protein M422DRAFT_66369 [Sphaerobolus stellatus SS14]|nr:hypothetical protein M422DRAFT_66369 [Sphaerobolus stellatus SS14]